MQSQIFPPLFEKGNTNENYRLWESIVLALFENFKFNYEILGTSPPPENDKEFHPCHFLKDMESYKAQEYFFHEKNHVHFNSYLGYGNKFTGYPMGESIAYHHFTLETYQFVWKLPLYYISNWEETFPLLFSTQNNLFMESCNSTFLQDKRYLKDQEYPASHPFHRGYFSAEYFKQVDLPPSLLLNSFLIKGIVESNVIKTLNFCLKLFQEAVLIQSALMEIFGKSHNKQEQIGHLKKCWDYPNGTNIKGLSLYRLNILAFLYLSLHPAATALCYGLYRNKYGVITSHRTAFYVKYEGNLIALKDFLQKQAQSYLNLLNGHLLKRPDLSKQAVEMIIRKMTAALDLCRMYGIGYETNHEKGVNIHKNAPKDLRPKIIAEQLSGLNYVIEHENRSPFWRIFYDYCSEWWSKEEIEQVLLAKGEIWERLKSSPRPFAIHIFHKIAAYFWQENLKSLKVPDAIRNKIAETCSKIIG